jgi:hypothetical protein
MLHASSKHCFYRKDKRAKHSSLKKKGNRPTLSYIGEHWTAQHCCSAPVTANSQHCCCSKNGRVFSLNVPTFQTKQPSGRCECAVAKVPKTRCLEPRHFCINLTQFSRPEDGGSTFPETQEHSIITLFEHFFWRYRRLNAIVAQCKNCQFGFNTTFEIKT